ncbi:hypothetical protein NUSPORA_01983 [Nucleospora cyclopteri]
MSEKENIINEPDFAKKQPPEIIEIGPGSKHAEQSHYEQLLNAVKILLQQHESGSQEEKQEENVVYYRNLLLEIYGKIDRGTLENLEYALEFLCNKENSHLWKNYFIVSDFIRFLVDFAATCDKTRSLYSNFLTQFVDFRVVKVTKIIERLFNSIFFLEDPTIINFCLISVFYTYLQKQPSEMKYLNFIRKKLLNSFIVEIMNKYELELSKVTVTSENLAEISQNLGFKINALNGCVYKKILNITNIDKFIFLYLSFLLKRKELIYFVNQTDACLFYCILVLVTNCGGKTRFEREMRTNLQMFILLELKWPISTTENDTTFNFESSYKIFMEEYGRIVGNVKRITYPFFKPKYKYHSQDAFCQVIKTKTGVIYTHLTHESPKSMYSTSKKGISPFSGRLSLAENSTSNAELSKRKLEFD